MGTIGLGVNGRRVEVEVDPGESLLDVLRERLGITSPKDGCQPQGQCGCCVVLVDGVAKTSCATEAERCDGREIATLEGIAPEERDLIARAFVAAGSVQCGFCMPGIALRTKHLLDRSPSPTRAEIARALDGHLCRCTGYVKVLDAVELLARARRGEPLPEPGQDGRVGQPYARVRGPEMVLGQRPFVADMQRDGLLHGALVLSPHARARVQRIDVTRAAALPGVHVVATAADVPGDRWNGLLHDDWPCFVAVGEEVRCVGDVLAAVAADDERTARAAARLVEVDYEVLPPVLDPALALRDDAPQINPVHASLPATVSGSQTETRAVDRAERSEGANVLGRTVIRRGNVEAALAASAHVVEGTWQTQRIEHLFLEPECCLAEPLPDNRLALFTASQGIFDDRRQVARVLGWPEERIDAELVPPGGGFGGKEDMSVQAQTALLAVLTGRPVRLKLNREESIRIHPKRHPMTLAYTVGCDEDGRLTAVRARIVGDSGAYASVGAKVLERAAGHACGPYRVPNVDVEALAVYTNNPPCGAMRGFGANQAAFAIEGAIDLLAKKAGLDRWEIRYRNALDVGDVFSTGQVMEAGVGIRATLEAAKPAWDAANAAGKAVGIACGIKNSGLGNGVREWGKCRLVVEADETVSLYNGFTDMGQGLFTILAQFASEVTSLPADTFRPAVDSRFALGCGQTTGSRATILAGRATIDAATRLRDDLVSGRTLRDLAGRIYAGAVEIIDTTPLGAPVDRVKTHTAFGYATQLCVLDDAGRVERIVAVHDVGRVVNPVLCTAQIEGAVHMGLGYALTEELRCENGMPVTFKLRDLGVLRARDMPEVEVVLVEVPEPEGPMGAKGVGEIGLVPTAPAVASALEAYDGKRRMVLPMKDSPAARAMSVGRIRADPGAPR